MINVNAEVWEPRNNGLYGSHPNTLVFSPDGNIVYAGINSGLFKSMDYGYSWNWILGGSFYALAVNPSDPEIIYAGTNSEGIYQSIDGGDNWEQINDGLTSLDIRAISVDPVNSNIVYAGTADGIFKSVDNGDNWVAKNTGLTNLDIRALSIDPITPSALYTGTGDGVFKSIDNADNWVPKNTGLGNLNVLSLAINPVTTGTVYAGTSDSAYRSLNGGDEWARIGEDMLQDEIKEIAINLLSPEILYAGGSGVYKSTDSGDNWTQVADIGGSSLGVNPVITDTVYAGQWGNPNALFKSNDAGTNWEPVNLIAVPFTAFAVDPSDTKTIYVGSMNDVFKSIDCGENWTRKPCSITHTRALAINPSASNIIYAGGERGDDIGLIFRSDDSGENWEDITDVIVTTNIFVLTVNPNLTNIVYAGTDDGIYRSMDDGDTWTDITHGIHPDVRDIDIASDNTDIVYAATDGGIFKSIDGGDSWVYKGLNGLCPSEMAINPESPDTIYVGFGCWEGVYRSIDGGENWEQINEGLTWPEVSTLVINQKFPNVVYAGTAGGGVFRSEDGGDHWMEVNEGLGLQLNVAKLVIGCLKRGTSTVFAEGFGGVFAAEFADGGLCSFNIISSDSEEIEKLHQFRDKALKGSKVGQELINVYYQQSPEVARILIDNPGMIIRSAAILTDVMPGIRHLIGDRNGRDITITPHLVARIDRLFSDIADEGSEELAETLSALIDMLEEHKGERISQIWGYIATK
jgi:photosystem II stability/assembly factor-like uncharacterized protein